MAYVLGQAAYSAGNLPWDLESMSKGIDLMGTITHLAGGNALLDAGRQESCLLWNLDVLDFKLVEGGLVHGGIGSGLNPV